MPHVILAVGMVKKKIVLVGLALFLAAAILGGIFIFLKFKKTPGVSEKKETVASEVLPAEKLNEYVDGSGFVFRYPENVTVQSQKEPATSVYSDLTLSSEKVSGSISLKVSETKIASLIKTNEPEKEIKLGGLAGREIKTEKGLSAAVLDQGVLFNIEVDFGDNKNFWEKVYETFLSNFSFSQTSVTEETTVSGGEVIFEGEEIID